jgi:hypothetical protein
LAKGDRDEGCAPAGMLAPQGQGGLANPVWIGVGEILGCVRVGGDAFRSAITESFPQMSHGARGKIEGGRETGGRLPLFGTLE